MTKRFKVPQYQIDSIVGRYHVGTAPEVIAAEMRKRLAVARLNDKPLTVSQVSKCVEYALKSHRSNLDLYQYVMCGGRR